MSCILYYSNYCKNCGELIRVITKDSKSKEMHFICIDKREKHNDGSTKIILENGEKIMLPPTISSVPSLLLLNEGHRVIKGDQILDHLNLSNRQNVVQLKQENVKQSVPDPFAFMNSNDVASDNFSFLDQELSAQGEGGLRQLHHYTAIHTNPTIETPEETYKSDTIGNSGVTMDKIQSDRNQMFNN